VTVDAVGLACRERAWNYSLGLRRTRDRLDLDEVDRAQACAIAAEVQQCYPDGGGADPEEAGCGIRRRRSTTTS
jgi:hypothetical protein